MPAGIHRASERFPGYVALRRLAAGLEIPSRGEELMASAAAVDEGPIAAAALDLTGNKWVGQAAATVVGPETLAPLFMPCADYVDVARRPGGSWPLNGRILGGYGAGHGRRPQ
jgi:hypothetical protein